ncbi:TetR/AcrR family transcriptional regulator [Jongsikchunia kroppenstedtii]|uniref:TetR/AcrR family transcriptional regulator n=1 Tax=Jongsikchunia kroppenstedtii TaxID=1121721 RepID=UPI00036F3C8C|nr:TetR/AcrR family transcriptional regulator [Jongsikchunia kroppenstedtii]
MSTPDRLPRGPHKLERKDVLASQRQRMCLAVLDVVAEEGFAATSISKIVARAGVSRRSFYELFSDKVDCFGNAIDMCNTTMQTRMDEAWNATEDTDPADQVEVSFTAYLQLLADVPAAARALHVELPSISELASRREHIMQVFAAKFRDAHRQGVDEGSMKPVHPGVFDFIVGGVDDQIRRCIQHRGTAELPNLASPLTQSILLLLGADPDATRSRIIDD